MAMNLGIKRQTYAPSENQEWLGSSHGTQSMDSITLDADACLAVFPTGLVPSGIKLGKITATGLYAPALTASADGSQTPVGHLFTTVDLTAGGAVPAAGNDTPASLLWHGEVVSAKVPVVAGAAAAAAPNFRYV